MFCSSVAIDTLYPYHTFTGVYLPEFLGFSAPCGSAHVPTWAMLHLLDDDIYPGSYRVSPCHVPTWSNAHHLDDDIYPGSHLHDHNYLHDHSHLHGHNHFDCTYPGSDLFDL